eukprot:3608964-Pleurochrysis_carterae.AAC.2
MSALDMAHAADRKWPLESARHALVSRRSAARAKAEVCGCVLHNAIRLPVAPGAGAGTCDRVSVDSRDAAPHRTSASDNNKRYVGLALRWRRTAARGCSVACNRCAGTYMGSNAPRSHSCLAPIVAAAPRAATLRKMEASAHRDS